MSVSQSVRMNAVISDTAIEIEIPAYAAQVCFSSVPLQSAQVCSVSVSRPLSPQSAQNCGSYSFYASIKIVTEMLNKTLFLCYAVIDFSQKFATQLKERPPRGVPWVPFRVY